MGFSLARKAVAVSISTRSSVQNSAAFLYMSLEDNNGYNHISKLKIFIKKNSKFHMIREKMCSSTGHRAELEGKKKEIL